MEQKGLDEAQGKENEKEEYLTPPDKAKLLLEMEFQETKGKPGLWYKSIDEKTVFFWSFQKLKKGVSWCNRDNTRISEVDKKAMVEYTYIRQEIVTEKPDAKARKSRIITPKSDEKALLPAGKKQFIRGTEKDIIRIMDEEIQLDSIIAASEKKDKLGEGILWHELKFGNKISLCHVFFLVIF